MYYSFNDAERRTRVSLILSDLIILTIGNLPIKMRLSFYGGDKWHNLPTVGWLIWRQMRFMMHLGYTVRNLRIVPVDLSSFLKHVIGRLCKKMR